MRDPLECIAELLGNPSFQNEIQFSPQRLWTDATKANRVYGEMWTGDRWWDLQVGFAYSTLDHFFTDALDLEVKDSRPERNNCEYHPFFRQDKPLCVQWRQTGLAPLHHTWKHFKACTPTDLKTEHSHSPLSASHKAHLYFEPIKTPYQSMGTLSLCGLCLS